LGNYDVNVLSIALKKHNLVLEWFDPRNKLGNVITAPPSESENSAITSPCEKRLIGIVMNVPSPSRLLSWCGGRHFLALRRFGVEEIPEYTKYAPEQKVWMNLDSKLASPYIFNSDDELVRFVIDTCDATKGGTHILRVFGPS